MSKKSDINLGKIIADTAGIVFAVLLALWLDNWWQDAELQKLADDMNVKIEAEINENKQELVEAIDNNADVLTMIFDVMSAEELDVNSLAGMEFNAANVRHSSWNSAQMTSSINLMGADEIATLADIYETQKYFVDYNQEFFRQIAPLIVNIQVDNDKKSLQIYATHIGISNSLGAQLLEKYNVYLAK